MKQTIPFNRPFVTGRELTYIAQAVNSGALAADGHFTRGCSRILSETLGIRKVLMTPSCSTALEMSTMLCNLGPQDEVILPSFTFVSTANAVVRLNARPVFVDIRPDTLNLDENLIEEAITPNTKAIIPVHYGGIACEMDRIMTIADNYNLKVIEDAAQGVNSFYNGRALGSIGHLGAFSFHHTKNYVCGEGGALCVNSPELDERAEIVREKGTNRSQFLRGEVDKYTWVDIGSSFIPSEISCAFLYAQLQRIDWITERRREIYEFYRHQLESLEERGLIKLPFVPEACSSNYHVLYILLPDSQIRDGLMARLKENGIEAVFHYVPLHSSPMGKKFGYREQDLPVTEAMSSRLLRLPVFPGLTEEEQVRVVHEVNAFLQDVVA